MPFITTSAGGDGSGVPGPQGVAGADALWNFLGEYNNGADYNIGDVVTYNGGTYYRILGANPGYAPGTEYWTTVAAPGLSGEGGDTADFVFTNDENETGRSIISLPGDKGMTIAAGEDSDLYLTAGDDLYIQTLGEGDDIHLNAADDIRFTTKNESNLDGNTDVPSWRMDSEGRFQLPGDGYISNPYAETLVPQTGTVFAADNYLNDQSGLNQGTSVALPVSQDTLWFINNYTFTSPVTITFADSTTADVTTIYDATSQGIPAIIFQWNDERNKTFAETFPLTVSVQYNLVQYGNSIIELDPQWLDNDQKLVIDATAPNHIHLRAGGEIDNSSAELFLGGEDTHVRITDQSGSVEILGTDITISSYASPSSLNINTYSGARINSARTSDYEPEDRVVATLGDLIPGIQGEIGPAGRGFRFMGEWNDVFTYVIDDVVTFDGESYIAIQGSTVEYPPNTMYWTKIAAKGAQGEPGLDAEVVEEVSFTVNGGTLGIQPTFAGPPMFSGSYIKHGSLVHFQIQVDMDNITSFGTGQYYVELPFPAKYGYKFREGCLHDISTGRDYAIGGHVYAGQSQLTLTSTDTQSGTVFDIPFVPNNPTILDNADNFHISGTYIIQEGV